MKEIELELDDQAKTFIIEKGYNPDCAAPSSCNLAVHRGSARGDCRRGVRPQQIKVTREDDHLYFSSESIASSEGSEDAPRERARGHHGLNTASNRNGLTGRARARPVPCP